MFKSLKQAVSTPTGKSKQHSGTSIITKSQVQYVLKHFHISRPPHSRQSPKYSVRQNRDGQAYSQGACSALGSQERPNSCNLPKCQARGRVLAVELREMLSAVAVPPNFSTESYLKCWPNCSSVLKDTTHYCSLFSAGSRLLAFLISSEVMGVFQRKTVLPCSQKCTEGIQGTAKRDKDINKKLDSCRTITHSGIYRAWRQEQITEL